MDTKNKDSSKDKAEERHEKRGGIKNTDVHYDEKKNERERSDDFFNVYRIKSIILLVFVIVIYIVLFSILNSTKLNSPETKPWILVIEVILWVVLIVILVMNVRYFNDKDFNFNDTFKHLFDDDKKPEIVVHVDKGHIPEQEHNRCEEPGEVFHVGGNNYTYQEAQDVCSTYDARLASYDEIEKAYNNGGNWCSYGWSDGQLALFPIQKAIYNELKKVPGHEHDCGRPGVNGGYMKNKNIKFGVNCYGKKPYASDKDLDYMNKHKYLSISDEEIQKKKDEKINKFLISPFNKDKWSDSL
jgi:hypothetical protein